MYLFKNNKVIHQKEYEYDYFSAKSCCLFPDTKRISI